MTMQTEWGDRIILNYPKANWHHIPFELNHFQTMGYLSCFATGIHPAAGTFYEKGFKEGKEYYISKRREILQEYTPKDLVLLIESFIQ